MKVFILTGEPFPHGMAATNRITKYAQGLIANGIDCEVIITARTEPYHKVRNNKNCGISHDQIKFTYIPDTTTRSRKFFTRRVYDLYDYLRVSYWIKQNIHCGDVVLFYNLQLLGMRRIIKTCHNNGIKIVRELCELPYGTQSDSAKNKLLRSLYEKFVMPHFDGFIAISQALEQYAHSICSGKTPIIKIPILIDVNQYNDINPYIHNNPYIFHAGTMYERKDAIVSTIKAFAIASKKIGNSLDFILAGPESPHKSELEQIISDNDLYNNIHFIGSLTHNEVLSYQKGAWLTILNKHDNPQNRNGFSTKLGDVLLAGTPVITTTVGEANNFLRDGESALITQPGDTEAIAELIVRAYNNPKLLASISMTGKQIAKECFDSHRQGGILTRFLINEIIQC